jgi:predicted small lipoprotein YifL
LRRALAVVLLILVAVFVALGACGKKGPPFLSERNTPVKVEKLSAAWKNRAVMLRERFLPVFFSSLRINLCSKRAAPWGSLSEVRTGMPQYYRPAV